jgi:hypothetical protein
MTGGRRRDRRGASRGWAATLAVALQATAVARPAATDDAYELPAQWSRQADGDIEKLAPPGEDARHVALLLLPMAPLAADTPAQFDRLRQAIGERLALKDAREVAPVQQGRDATAPYLRWTASYAPAAPASGRIWVTLMARGVGASFIGALFVADSPERLRTWLPTSALVFKNLRVSTAQPPEATARAAPASPATGAGPTAVPIGMGVASLAALAGTWAGNTTQRVSSLGTFGRGGVTLKIATDGRYDYFHEHVDPGCTVTRSGSGTLSIVDGLLVMQPAKDHEHRIRHQADALCTGGDSDLPLRARRFKYDVEALDLRGQASYQLSIWSDTEPGQAMARLAPRPQPAAMPRPATLAAPTMAPSGWMLGAWRATAPPSPAWRLDARAGLAAYAADLEFLAGGRYRLHVHRPDVLDSPVCTKSVDLDEEGEAQETLGPPNQARARIGSLALVPLRSQLSERVERCGADDGTATRELSHAPRYLFLRQLDGQTDKLELGCNLAWVAGRAEYPAWSYLSCADTADILSGGYLRP